jgi:hypothetical protein
MNASSPWVLSVKAIFNDPNLPAIFERKTGDCEVKLHHNYNALWLSISYPQGTRIIARTAYAPNDPLAVSRLTANEDGVTVSLSASIGKYTLKIGFPETGEPLIYYSVTLTPAADLLLPFWPRELVILGPHGSDKIPDGEVLVAQRGTRSGLQYLKFGQSEPGSLLYFQNLTALNDYAEATGTSLSGVVGGTWPELGLSLPQTTDKPLPAGKKVVLSDAFLLFSP